jgi:hypothetical protein
MAEPDYQRLTFVFAMPRSRSRWLAWFMRENGINSFHDPLANCRTPLELLHKVRGQLWTTDGPLVVVDTGAIFFQRALRGYMPTMKRAYSFRNPEDIAKSVYAQTKIDKLPLLTEQNERMYRYAYDDGNNFRFQYGLMDQRMGEFWKFVTGEPMPPEVAARHNECRSRKIDVPLRMQVPDLFKMRQLERHREKD